MKQRKEKTKMGLPYFFQVVHPFDSEGVTREKLHFGGGEEKTLFRKEQYFSNYFFNSPPY